MFHIQSPILFGIGGPAMIEGKYHGWWMKQTYGPNFGISKPSHVMLTLGGVSCMID